MSGELGVLFAAFEAVPFMKTGGLGDVAGSLPIELKKAGCDVRVIIPKFRTMPEEYKSKLTHVTDFYVPLGWRSQYCGIEKLEHKGVTFYFVDNESYFYRDEAYGYFDDGERIAFFSKAIVECVQYLSDFKCDIIHCNDWHTALAPVFLREFYGASPVYRNIKTVFTVHNLKFQGQFTDLILGDILGLSHITPAVNQLRIDSRSINYMKGALCYSDILSTVSPSYAGEIQSGYYGERMDDIFRRRSSILYGILNGIDTDFYNPQKDTNIAANFSKGKMEGKKECKLAIQRELGLPENPDVPLIIMIGRLTEQKGMDLLRAVMDEIMCCNLQMAVLGTGDSEYENMLNYYSGKYYGKLAVRIMFDESLSHRMYAGADMLLMPSKFEPCGLSQMIAMAYGTLPVVREVGGLKDSVKPYNMYTGEGTGFSFSNYNAHEMLYTIRNAVHVYYDEKEAWKKLVENAMTEDFGWETAAENYMDMYFRLCPEKAVAEEPAIENVQGNDNGTVMEPVKEAESSTETDTVEKKAETVDEDKKEDIAEKEKTSDEIKSESDAKKVDEVKAVSRTKRSASKSSTSKKSTAKNSTSKNSTSKNSTAAKRTTTRKRQAAQTSDKIETKTK